ncbi:MAG: hypothetical protein JKY42_12475, partial [Flavobacteriales bacterium]|nr:hypothetical protein [Flavobacteriales bacterium]
MDNTGSRLTYVTSKKMDPLLMGVHSTSPSLLLNDPDEGTPVALSGRVPVNVINENGSIQPGDYLTSSSTRGTAMKATENCYVIGRAMEPLTGEKGQVMCLISSGWYNPNPNTEGVVSGSYYFPAGATSVKIFDESVSEFSRVFITMRDNPGSYFWVNNVKDGFFEISLGKEADGDVKFDYLVNRASTPTEIGETVSNIVDGEKELDDEACIDCERGESFIGTEPKGIDISQIAFSMNPPSPPPSIDYVWTWDPINGFVKPDVEINQLVDENKKRKEASKANKNGGSSELKENTTDPDTPIVR